MRADGQRIDYSDLDLWDELEAQLHSRPCSGLRELDDDDDDGRSVGCADLVLPD